MSETAFYEDQYEDGPESRARRNAFGKWLAALASLALVGAVVVWAWSLGVRDASEIPVIKALTTPMKVRPDDPGGLKLEDTDLAVNRILSDQPDEAVTELAPVPERPAADDRPVEPVAIAPAAPVQDNDAAAAPEPVATAPALPAAPEPAQKPEDAARIANAENNFGLPPKPDRTGAAEDTPAPSAESAPEPEPAPAPADIPGATASAPGFSPAAARRPAGLDTSPRPVVEEIPQIRSGDVVIQLGAFDTEDIANTQWRRKQARHEDLLRGLASAVTTTQSGGRTLYRLRVGPLADGQRAQALCAALKERGDDCIPTRF